jgi:pimeloyl-ACP methyl ester carboxylesterase
MKVQAGGITQNVLVWGPEDGRPVLLIHGNCSSAAYWEPFVRFALADGVPWRIVAPDLRGYGETDPAPVDATRALRDFADDVTALLPLVFPAGARPVVAGHSMGGGVAMHLTIAQPELVSGLLLEAPVSPYGFGGTRDVDGTRTTDDFAGTGAGGVNPEFLSRLAAGDRSADDPASPRNVLRTFYVADPDAFGADEDAMLDSLLSTVAGPGNYPGDSSPVPSWPTIGPGTRGVLNAMSPKYFSIADELIALSPKPPVTWMHGTADAIVGDASLFDLAQLGKLGAVPGWPGEDACPPQPMIAQTRRVLERYAAAGGSFTEVELAGCGHSPHIERKAEVLAALRALAG